MTVSLEYETKAKLLLGMAVLSIAATLVWFPAFTLLLAVCLGVVGFLALGRGRVYLGDYLLMSMGILALIFAIGFKWSFFTAIGKTGALLLIALASVDLYFLFTSGDKVSAQRRVASILSMGEENPVEIVLHNHSDRDLEMSLIDELPEQLQIRDFMHALSCAAGEQKKLAYTIRPTTRGEYLFGDVQVMISGPLNMFKRRLTQALKEEVKVLPSIMQMKEFELRAYSRTADAEGMKRLRKAGVSYEFEQISPYVKGDDIRHINWKASARGQELMVNRYEVERSQSVYNVICKSREMCMPFNGMSLLDYAINTTLAVSNVALLKYDRAGLITFSDKVGSILRATRDRKQIKLIMNALYNETERDTESNYGLLDRSLRKLAPNRSLIFLYINFESMYALERALPHLRAIARRHLLVLVFFENVEISTLAATEATDLRGIYTQTIAQRMLTEKRAMLARLRQAQIQAILTRPDRLSMNTVNKYLELKGRGAI